LNLEITMTEDQPGDIKALLGRSEDRGLEALNLTLRFMVRAASEVALIGGSILLHIHLRGIPDR
jgi:hypothetical protein